MTPAVSLVAPPTSPTRPSRRSAVATQTLALTAYSEVYTFVVLTLDRHTVNGALLARLEGAFDVFIPADKNLPLPALAFRTTKR